MRAAGLPVIAGQGFGNHYWQSRKTRINHGSCPAIAHIADVCPTKSYFNSSNGNGHMQYARAGFIGRIGKLGNKGGALP